MGQAVQVKTVFCAVPGNILVHRCNVGFIRRYITRPPDGNEDNYYLDLTAFLLLKQANFFVSTWHAHGNHYGIPAQTMSAQNGYDLILLSISRSAIVDFEQRHDAVTTIQVTVQEDVLRKRLQKRNREDDLEIQKRLARARSPVIARDLITFDNSSDLNSSICNFVDLLERLGSKLECTL